LQKLGGIFTGWVTTDRNDFFEVHTHCAKKEPEIRLGQKAYGNFGLELFANLACSAYEFKIFLNTAKIQVGIG